MYLSEQTITILKNFATINPSILFKKGSTTLRTISPQKTIMAKADIDEAISRDFAIYDLPRFLSVLSLFQNPEIELNDAQLSISNDKRKVVYTYADPSTFITPPAKEIVFPEPDVTFNLTNDDFQRVLKAGSVLQLPEFVVFGDGTQISLRACDIKNPSADSYVSTQDATNLVFTAVFKAENMKLLPNDYDVSISAKGISMFKSDKITYWIAQESSSTFNK